MDANLIVAAAQQYQRRYDGTERPAGTLDTSGHWVASAEERQPCCDALWPEVSSTRWLWESHCCTLLHILMLNCIPDAPHDPYRSLVLRAALLLRRGMPVEIVTKIIAVDYAKERLTGERLTVQQAEQLAGVLATKEQ